MVPEYTTTSRITLETPSIPPSTDHILGESLKAFLRSKRRLPSRTARLSQTSKCKQCIWLHLALDLWLQASKTNLLLISLLMTIINLPLNHLPSSPLARQSCAQPPSHLEEFPLSFSNAQMATQSNHHHQPPTYINYSDDSNSVTLSHSVNESSNTSEHDIETLLKQSYLPKYKGNASSDLDEFLFKLEASLDHPSIQSVHL